MKPTPPRLVGAPDFAGRAKKMPPASAAITVFRRLHPPDLGLRASGDQPPSARGPLGRVSPLRAPHAAAATQVVRPTAGARTDLPVIGPHRPHGLERPPRPSLSRGVPRPAPESVVGVPPPTAVARRVAPAPAVRRRRAPTDFSRAGDRLLPAVRP